MHNEGLLKEAETMTEKSAFDKTLGELHDLIEWEDGWPKGNIQQIGCLPE